MTYPRKKISRRTADEVRRHLHRQILAGELQSGQRIDLDQVAEALDVSRTPVREALLQLETEGLIERVPYRGAVVSSVDAGVVQEVLALRLHLESLAARIGVMQLDDEDLRQMQLALDGMDAIGHGPTDQWEFAHTFNDLNRDFHEALYRKANSPNLMRFIELLETQAERIRLHYDVKRENTSLHDQHDRILRACVARDADEAAAAVRAHIVAVLTSIIDVWPEFSLTPASPLWHALTPEELSSLLADLDGETAAPPAPQDVAATATTRTGKAAKAARPTTRTATKTASKATRKAATKAVATKAVATKAATAKAAVSKAATKPGAAKRRPAAASTSTPRTGATASDG